MSPVALLENPRLPLLNVHAAPKLPLVMPLGPEKVDTVPLVRLSR